MEEILWFALGAASMLAFIATMVLVDEHRAARNRAGRLPAITEDQA